MKIFMYLFTGYLEMIMTSLHVVFIGEEREFANFCKIGGSVDLVRNEIPWVVVVHLSFFTSAFHVLRL